MTLDTLTDSFWQHASESVWEAIIDAATENHTPKPLTRLPLLDWFANVNSIPMRDDCVAIFHSHLLETNYDLIKHTAHLVGENNLFITEKPYSTMPSVFNKIVQTGAYTNFVDIEEKMPYGFSIKRSVDYTWHEVVNHVRAHNIRKIVIISDGGNFLTSIPWHELKGVEVSAVEQTQSGINKTRNLGTYPPPMVNVA